MNERDKTTLRVIVGFVTTESADETMIYEITRTLIEGAAGRNSSGSWLKVITPEGALADNNIQLPADALRALEKLAVSIPDIVCIHDKPVGRCCSGKTFQGCKL